MSGASVAAGALQIAGGLLAPGIAGTIQTSKARMQGRRGPSPLQPYRELRRLWGKSGVDPQPRTALYALAPAVVAASTFLALLLIPIGAVAPDWGLGHDALVLVGLLALGRFAMALAAWDTGSAFALMGAARDLMLSVFVEVLLLLVLLLLALPAGSTDLISIAHASAAPSAWSTPAHWVAAIAFYLVALAETGRQPIDNPDTHLELTMVHEGPLLEYAGRDLAYLQWAAAARHWIVIALACDLLLPHPGAFSLQVAAFAAGGALITLALAATETAQAKMRLLRVPPLVGSATLLCLLALASWFLAGGR